VEAWNTAAMAGREKVDLQIRGMSAVLRQRIRKRATDKGVSMSKYVIGILQDKVDRPDSINEWLDEVMSIPPVPGLMPGDGAKAIRAMRDAIDRP
jgi:hypothetical protein